MAAVVGDVMCTCLLPPAAMVPKLQVRTPDAMEHPESLPAASIVQLRPASVGRVSVTVTPEAEPAPLLLAVIVNPMRYCSGNGPLVRGLGDLDRGALHA